MQLTESTHFHLQATRLTPGPGNGTQNKSTPNDPDQNVYQKHGRTVVSGVISILVNVIGGTLLLSGMFFLPQIVAGLLGH